MRQVAFTKYAFRIRTRLGLVVDNLTIHGKDELEALIERNIRARAARPAES